MSTSTNRTSLRSRAAIGALALAASGVFFALSPPAGAQTPTPIGAYTTKDAWSFVSALTLHPPKLRSGTNVQPDKLAKGDFLVASFPNIDKPGPMDGQSGPLILDSRLQPVWFKPLPTDVVAMDLKEQTYDGKPALSWWQGVVTGTGATVSGKVVVVNQHYHEVAVVAGKDGWVISPHDVVISGHDAWVTSCKDIKGLDLSAYGGAKNGTLYDFAVQEYDLQTGRLLYSWDAYRHVALSESYQVPPAKATVPWDAYHGNSVDLVGNGQFLVSMRNTWAAYLVDAKTGKIAWTLGGKDTAFSVPSSARFEWQHDVTLSKDDILTLFDDNCCEVLGGGTFGSPGGPAKGLVLKLHQKKRTVTLVHQYLHGANFDVAFTGSMQVLPNGNALVGWGSQPYFSEYTKAGKMLLDAVFPGKDLSYRALFTDGWVGTPDFPPSGAARTVHGETTVYASWNGATQVAAWRVLAGRAVGHLRTVATKAKSGFETAIPLARSYKLFKVQALDARGQELGTSEAFMIPTAGNY
jgi:hypothetical protein